MSPYAIRRARGRAAADGAIRRGDARFFCANVLSPPETGAADLIFDQAGSNLVGSTFETQQGRLLGVNTSGNPFGAANLKINSGEIILASGGGRGGGAVFAMDVTDPDNPEVMWQQTLPNGAPMHYQVQITTIGDRAVALVGSGLEESAAAGAWIWSGFFWRIGSALASVGGVIKRGS